MQKRYPNQRWMPPLPSQAEKSKTSRLAVWAEHLSSVRKILLDMSFFALLIGFGVVVYKELKRTEIILDAIEVPEELKKSGYTGTVIAEKLLDEARRIGFETRELSRNTSWRKEAGHVNEMGVDMHMPDIQVPGAGFTLRLLVRYLRQEMEMGFKTTYLRGEIIEAKSGYCLTLRNISEKDSPAVQTQSQSDLEQLLHEQGGDALLKVANPSILAVRAYHGFDKQIAAKVPYDKAYKTFNELIDYCLKYPPSADNALAFTLKGNVLKSLKRPEEAIVQFKNALDLDPNYAYAYNGWGSTLQKLKQYEEAIAKFQKATELYPDYAIAYSNWGNALNYLKRFDEAIAKHQKATDLDPNYAYAFINWGVALSNLERYDEAIAKFQKAADLDPNYAVIYNNWGIALEKMGRSKEAEEKFKIANKLDPSL